MLLRGGYNCLVMRIHGVTNITSFKGVSNKNEVRLMLLIYMHIDFYSWGLASPFACQSATQY